MKQLAVLIAALLAWGSDASAQTGVISGNTAVTLNILVSDLFAQNIPNSGEIEAEYMEMWSQDATAMSTYQTLSSSMDSSYSSIFGPITMSADYGDSGSSFTFTSGTIPVGSAGYQLTINLRSSIQNLPFDESEPISDFDLENVITLVYSDGVNTTTDTGTIVSYGVQAVPEPATWALALCGAGALALRARRRRTQPAAGKRGTN